MFFVVWKRLFVDLTMASNSWENMYLCKNNSLHYFKGFPIFNKWAAIWQNQQNECAPNEDSDQPGYPSSLIRVSLATHWAHSEVSDQTVRMPRLIWIFAGRTLILLVLSCRGSNVMCITKRAGSDQLSCSWNVRVADLLILKFIAHSTHNHLYIALI